jgi:hypothetical protein
MGDSTLTRTGRIEKIAEGHPTRFIEIHPRDAASGKKNDEWVEGSESRRRFA